MGLTYILEMRIGDGENGWYGIKIYEDGVLVAVYPDLTVERERLERFCERCNRAGVSRIHLDDLIEDFLG